MWYKIYYFLVSGMSGNFVNVIAEASDIKQECEEDDLLDIVDR